MDLRDHSLSHFNFVRSAQVNAKFFYVQYFGLILCYTEYFLTAGFLIFFLCHYMSELDTQVTEVIHAYHLL